MRIEASLASVRMVQPTRQTLSGLRLCLATLVPGLKQPWAAISQRLRRSIASALAVRSRSRRTQVPSSLKRFEEALCRLSCRDSKGLLPKPANETERPCDAFLMRSEKALSQALRTDSEGLRGSLLDSQRGGG